MTDMTTGPALRRIVAFALPLTAANLMQQGYVLADSIIVGHYVGVEGLAAVGACGPLFYLLNALFIGLGTAFTIRLAHLRGAGEADQRADVVRAMLLFTTAWALGCVLLATVLGSPALSLMGIHGQLAADCRRFFGVLALGFPGIFGLAAVSAFLRGLGDSRAAMWIQGCGSVMNVVLVWLLVGPLRCGIMGAALATATASTVALLVGLIYARRTFPTARKGSRTAARAELVAAIRLGFPLASQHIVLALGIMVLVWIIQSYGTVVLAAFTVVSRIELFASMLFLDFSGGVTAFVAQNLGAGNEKRIRRGVLDTMCLTAVLSLLISAVILIERGPIAGIFIHDHAARMLTSRYIIITYPFLIFYAVMVVAHGYLNGARRTAAPLVCTIIAFVLVQIPTAYLLHGPFGIDAVMWAVVAGWSAGLVYTLGCLRRLIFQRSPTFPPTGPVAETSPVATL